MQRGPAAVVVMDDAGDMCGPLTCLSAIGQQRLRFELLPHVRPGRKAARWCLRACLLVCCFSGSVTSFSCCSCCCPRRQPVGRRPTSGSPPGTRRPLHRHTHTHTTKTTLHASVPTHSSCLHAIPSIHPSLSSFQQPSNATTYRRQTRACRRQQSDRVRSS